MIRKPLVPLLVLTAVLLWIAAPAFAKDLVVKEPPDSLKKLYPPQSKEPKWIQQMHAISGNFSGVFTNMGEGDWENAEQRAQDFYKAYKETSELVPEWEDYFDLKAAKNFVDVVKTHDPKQIGEASGAVGKTCGKCHADQYVSVWAQFHWPRVDKIKIVDPVSEEELKYGKYMHKVSGSFNAVTTNFKEGQYDRSAKAVRGFKQRFMELKSTCSKCHTTDAVKQFFVGDDVEKAFDDMRAELMKEQPNPGVFWKNVGIIGKEGCKKCHLTHRGWAMIQEYWEAGTHKH